MNERLYIAGSALWTEFDFGSEPRGENMPSINNKEMHVFRPPAERRAFLLQ
jgi:hypothetical protein